MLLAALFLLLFQRRLLYPSPHGLVPEHLPRNVERINLSNGAFCLLIKPYQEQAKPYPLMIFTHGNAETAYQWLDGMDELTAAGIGVCLVEYPGYADATGRSSKDSLAKTIVESYDKMIHRKDVDSERIFAYGRSIGGAVAMLLADQRPLAAVCLESTFSTLARLVREKGYPSFLLRDRFDNLKIIKRLKIPVWIFHGSEDELIQVDHARQLADSAREVELHVAPCGHNSCQRPWKLLIQFLYKHQILKD